MENKNINAILHGFTPDKLSRLITDAIIGGNFKTKGEARQRVEDILKAFLKVGVSNASLNKAKHQYALAYETRQKIYWQRKMKELHPDKIEEMYREIEEILISEGFKAGKDAPIPEPLNASGSDTGK